MTKYAENGLKVVIGFLVAIMVILALDSRLQREASYDTNYSTSETGRYSRFIDEEYNIVCYQTSNLNLDCLKLD